MRFYLRGPRILGIGTGISFGPEDFRNRNTRASSNSSGGSFLYVITGDHERVKVGVSIDPNKRRAQLQTGSPFPLRIAYVAVTPGTGYDIEGEAKRTLDRYRCPDGSGDEWFNVPVELAVAAVNAAAFKRGQPLCQLTQDQLNETLRIMSLPRNPVVVEKRWSFGAQLALCFGCAVVIVGTLMFWLVTNAPHYDY